MVRVNWLISVWILLNNLFICAKVYDFGRILYCTKLYVLKLPENKVWNLRRTSFCSPVEWIVNSIVGKLHYIVGEQFTVAHWELLIICLLIEDTRNIYRVCWVNSPPHTCNSTVCLYLFFSLIYNALCIRESRPIL